MTAVGQYALSVVIPIHNSEAVIARTILRWKQYLVAANTEVMLVENGSNDLSWQLVQELSHDTEHAHFTILQSEKGMGNALKAGILASSGESILLSADDLPFGFDDLEQASLLDGHPPIVIGSKAHPDSQVSRSFARRMFTMGYRVMRRLVLGSKVGDTQGTIIANGAWLWGVAQSLDEPGFLFTTQLVRVAEVQGIDIVEVPVRLAADHDPKDSTVKWSDVFDMARGLARVRTSARRIAATTPREQA
jgi:glycosyltransferase involved in cell wall biosynthesis